MHMKRILIDATGIVNIPTGLSKYSYYLLKSLLKNNRYKFTVLHRKSLKKTNPLFQINSAHVAFIDIDVPTIGPKRDYIMFTMKKKIINHELFHCLSSYLPAFDLQVPSILTIHDLKYLLFPAFFNNIFKTMYYKWIIHRGIRNASSIITVSHSTKHDIESLGVESRKIHVIYEAPTIDQHVESIPPENLKNKRYFLFIGENRPHKNILRLIQVYKETKKRLNDICPLMVFAGARYESIIPTFGDNHLIFLGSVADSLLTTLYKNALALVYPSLYEGFGLPIVEAMKMGTPVITSNCSSMQEIAGNAAILIDPKNVNQLAEAMLNITQHENTRTRLIKLGRKRIMDFSWEKAARKVSELYEEILS